MITTRGLDANVNLTDKADCIKAAGFSWVARYYKVSPSSLSMAEAKALSAAGLYIVTVVEKGNPTAPHYFSHLRGISDAGFALAKSALAGQPHGSPIYFAVDYDASEAEVQNEITAYFAGVHETFAARGGLDPIGVYGSGLVCAHLLQHTPVSYAWLSMSMGWNGSEAFTGWNIKQGAGETVCGISVDTDVSRGHGGGWRIS